MLTRSSLLLALLLLGACANYPGLRRNAPTAVAPALTPDAAIRAKHERADREVAFDPKVAEQHHQEALELRERLSGPSALPTADSLRSVARFYLRMCRFAEAITLQDRARTILNSPAASPLERARLGIERTYAELGAGSPEQALPFVEPLLSLREAPDLDSAKVAFEAHTLRHRIATLMSDEEAAIAALRGRFDLALARSEFELWRVRALDELLDAYERSGGEEQAALIKIQHHILIAGSAGTAPIESPRRWQCTPAGPNPPPGYVKNNLYTLRELWSQLRKCNDTPPVGHASTLGISHVAFEIEASGAVRRARVVAAGLSDATTGCMLKVAAGARFDAPVGGEAVVLAPFRFKPL